MHVYIYNYQFLVELQLVVVLRVDLEVFLVNRLRLEMEQLQIIKDLLQLVMMLLQIMHLEMELR